eukprot:PhM_4_TR3064/c4_g1_i2/m.90964
MCTCRWFHALQRGLELEPVVVFDDGIQLARARGASRGGLVVVVVILERAVLSGRRVAAAPLRCVLDLGVGVEERGLEEQSAGRANRGVASEHHELHVASEHGDVRRVGALEALVLGVEGLAGDRQREAVRACGERVWRQRQRRGVRIDGLLEGYLLPRRLVLGVPRVHEGLILTQDAARRILTVPEQEQRVRRVQLDLGAHDVHSGDVRRVLARAPLLVAGTRSVGALHHVPLAALRRTTARHGLAAAVARVHAAGTPAQRGVGCACAVEAFGGALGWARAVRCVLRAFVVPALDHVRGALRVALGERRGTSRAAGAAHGRVGRAWARGRRVLAGAVPTLHLRWLARRRLALGLLQHARLRLGAAHGSGLRAWALVVRRLAAAVPALHLVRRARDALGLGRGAQSCLPAAHGSGLRAWARQGGVSARAVGALHTLAFRRAHGHVVHADACVRAARRAIRGACTRRHRRLALVVPAHHLIRLALLEALTAGGSAHAGVRAAHGAGGACALCGGVGT